MHASPERAAARGWAWQRQGLPCWPTAWGDGARERIRVVAEQVRLSTLPGLGAVGADGGSLRNRTLASSPLSSSATCASLNKICCVSTRTDVCSTSTSTSMCPAKCVRGGSVAPTLTPSSVLAPASGSRVGANTGVTRFSPPGPERAARRARRARLERYHPPGKREGPSHAHRRPPPAAHDAYRLARPSAQT